MGKAVWDRQSAIAKVLLGQMRSFGDGALDRGYRRRPHQYGSARLCVLTALGARLRGKKVVWYGHSTMEDFRKSFRGSDLLAPLFRRWITFCYGLGDVVITPSEYSSHLLAGYGIRKPVYTSLQWRGHGHSFHPDPALRASFRKRYGFGKRKRW